MQVEPDPGEPLLARLHGEQHVITLAEVVDAGSVRQEQASPEPGRYLLIHHVGVSRVVGGPLSRLVTRPAAAG